MIETENLVGTIVAGLQDKKAQRIVIANLTQIESTICKYMIICEGNSNTHVNSIATNLKEYVKKEIKERPLAIQGFENCEWIVADYADVMVHIMQRPAREFYNLEHLWQDAVLTEIADD